jgi:hypothetical protein
VVADYHPGGSVLATGSSGRKVTLWDAGTGAKLRECAGHTEAVDAVAFSPDGTRLATWGHGQRATAVGVALLRERHHHPVLLDRLRPRLEPGRGAAAEAGCPEKGGARRRLAHVDGARESGSALVGFDVPEAHPAKAVHPDLSLSSPRGMTVAEDASPTPFATTTRRPPDRASDLYSADRLPRRQPARGNGGAGRDGAIRRCGPFSAIVQEEP